VDEFWFFIGYWIKRDRISIQSLSFLNFFKTTVGGLRMVRICHITYPPAGLGSKPIPGPPLKFTQHQILISQSFATA